MLNAYVSRVRRLQHWVFDGANIWTSNCLTSNVTKLRAYDGAVLGTFAVGSNPSGIAFGGANVWVGNISSDSVTELRGSDGAVLGTLAVGSSPYDVAFDGANIWVTNFGSNNVTKLRACDGALLRTFPAGSGPYGIAFDGAQIWVANSGGNNVTKLRARDGVNLGTSPWGATRKAWPLTAPISGWRTTAAIPCQNYRVPPTTPQRAVPHPLRPRLRLVPVRDDADLALVAQHAHRSGA